MRLVFEKFDHILFSVGCLAVHVEVREQFV